MILRGLFEEPEVADARDEAELKWSRSQDSWDAIIFILQNDPTAGRPLNENGSVRALILEGARSKDIPTLEVVYTVDRDDFTIRKAVFSDAKQHQTRRG